jgi:outer membrane protein assembly factor BamB
MIRYPFRRTARLRWEVRTRYATLAGILVGAMPVGLLAQWPQWGGPRRDFTVDAKGLADKWPDGGPRKLWNRELGDGYATIAVDDGLLFTMYRVGEDEFAVALDSKTGQTVWEHKSPSPFTKVMAEYGPGPHTTPLIVGNHVYTIGTNMVMHCFEKKTGQVAWKHDIANEFGAPIPERGYGCSPIAYKNTVIVPVDRKREGGPPGAAAADRKEGGEGQMLVAFDAESGSPVWKKQDFEIGYASPILINLAGEEQLVFFSATHLTGLNPSTGDLLWSHPHPTQFGANLSTPLYFGDGIIFCSAAYDSGARAVKLTKKEGKTVPEELWFSKKMRIHHGNAVRVNDFVCGSSGDFGPAFFMAVEPKTGNILWRERGFKKANVVQADGKLIILDEDGELALAVATREGLKVQSQAKVGERYAWAAPTLVGKILYIRDRKNIMALDLG